MLLTLFQKLCNLCDMALSMVRIPAEIRKAIKLRSLTIGVSMNALIAETLAKEFSVELRRVASFSKKAKA